MTTVKKLSNTRVLIGLWIFAILLATLVMVLMILRGPAIAP